MKNSNAYVYVCVAAVARSGNFAGFKHAKTWLDFEFVLVNVYAGQVPPHMMVGCRAHVVIVYFVS